MARLGYYQIGRQLRTRTRGRWPKRHRVNVTSLNTRLTVTLDFGIQSTGDIEFFGDVGINHAGQSIEFEGDFGVQATSPATLLTFHGDFGVQATQVIDADLDFGYNVGAGTSVSTPPTADPDPEDCVPVSLASAVTDRYSAQQLINWTNPQDPEAGSINTARLDLAVCDVKGDFRRVTGRPLSLSSHEDVAVATRGVIAHLVQYSGQSDNSLMDRYETALISLRARATPKTNSVLTPSSERVGTARARPSFDTSRLREMLPASLTIGEEC